MERQQSDGSLPAESARTFQSVDPVGAAAAPQTALTATALEVLAYEYTTSLGRRGEIAVEHATFAARLLTDSRLDLLTTAMWVQYLLVGAYVSRTTVRATPSSCHHLLSRILSDAYVKTDEADAPLVEMLAGATTDAVAPIILRHLFQRGTTAVGRATLALGCALLVVQHHRLQAPPEPMLVLDLLRVARNAAVADAEPLQCALVAAVLAALTDIATPLVLADAASLSATLHVCGSVVEAAAETGQTWWVCEAVTVAARLVVRLVAASAEAGAACVAPLGALITRGASHLSGLTRHGSIGGRAAAMAAMARVAATAAATGSGGGAGAPLPALAVASADATLLDLLLDHLLGVLPAAVGRGTLGIQRAAQACLQAVAAVCERGDPLRLRGFRETDLPRLVATWVPAERHADALGVSADPAAAEYCDLARCAAISCIAQLARSSAEGREAVLGAGAIAALMGALAQPPAALRPAPSLPHWPGSLAAPVHAARALLLLVEFASRGEARPAADARATAVQEAVRLLLLRAPNASAALLSVVAGTTQAPFAEAAARLLVMVAATHPLSRHAASLHASAVVPGATYAAARWAAMGPPLEMDAPSQPLAARRPFCVSASRAADEVASLPPLPQRGGAAPDDDDADDSGAALAAEAQRLSLVRADASAHACVISSLEVLLSVTGALPRPAASTLLAESGGLALCAWLLGSAVAVSELFRLGGDTGSGATPAAGDAPSGSRGATAQRWMRVAALAAALVGNVIEDCPHLRGDAARALAGIGGFALLRQHLGFVVEVPRLLLKFRAAEAHAGATGSGPASLAASRRASGVAAGATASGGIVQVT